MTTITESEFVNEMEALAKDLLERAEEYGEDVQDLIHETADAHEWVIYYAKAQAICNLPSSITDAGEDWLEGIYEYPYSECETFNEVCTRLAYATVYSALCDAVTTLQEEA